MLCQLLYCYFFIIYVQKDVSGRPKSSKYLYSLYTGKPILFFLFYSRHIWNQCHIYYLGWTFKCLVIDSKPFLELLSGYKLLKNCRIFNIIEFLPSSLAFSSFIVNPEYKINLVKRKRLYFYFFKFITCYLLIIFLFVDQRGFIEYSKTRVWRKEYLRFLENWVVFDWSAWLWLYYLVNASCGKPFSYILLFSCWEKLFEMNHLFLAELVLITLSSPKDFVSPACWQNLIAFYLRIKS